MKNLYLTIGLPIKSEPETIVNRLNARSAKGSVSDSDYKDIKSVLLNEERKKIYDRNCAFLLQISTLRKELGLSQTEFWNKRTNHNFVLDGNPTLLLPRYFRKKFSPIDLIRNRMVAYPLLIGIGFLIVVLISYFDSERGQNYNSSTSGTHNPRAQKVDALKKMNFKTKEEIADSVERTLPVVDLPQTGDFTNIDNPVAPIRIVTKQSDENYFVKFCYEEFRGICHEFFIRGGDVLNSELPEGTYIAKYASGKRWFGRKHLFGPRTLRSKASSTFFFGVEGNQVSGYTIELIKQRDGNLREQPIDSLDFEF